MNPVVLVSAEHASRAVPAAWRGLFAGHEALLEGHRAWDPGTRILARELAAALNAPLLEGRVSRLLVDLNRSPHHPRLFSEFSRALPDPVRAALKARYWDPHWGTCRKFIEHSVRPVLHIACHSFAAELDGRVRDFEIGLLYDPGRASEKAWCGLVKRHLAAAWPGFRVRMNRPYRGTSNGLGQQHRKLFGPSRLAAMELEVNQRLVGSRRWPALRGAILAAVRRSVMEFDPENW